MVFLTIILSVLALALNVLSAINLGRMLPVWRQRIEKLEEKFKGPQFEWETELDVRCRCAPLKLDTHVLDASILTPKFSKGDEQQKYELLDMLDDAREKSLDSIVEEWNEATLKEKGRGMTEREKEEVRKAFRGAFRSTAEKTCKKAIGE